MKKTFFISIFSVFVFFACSGENNTQPNSNPTEANASAPQPRQEVVYKAISMTDKGDKIAFSDALGSGEVVKNPSKVVIFDLGALDTFEALGLSDKVVGVPARNLPAYLQSFKDVKSVGGVQEADFEAINELQPDLIIISGRQAKSYAKLKDIAPTLYASQDNKDFLTSFENKTLSLAKLYDKEAEAKAKLDELKAYIDENKKAIDSSKKGLIILTNKDRMAVFGPNSRFGIIHDVLGVSPSDTNIKIGTHGNSSNAEYLLEINPDYLFVVDRNVITKAPERASGILDNAIVAKTNAAQNGKIIYLDPEYWYLSGGGLESFRAMSEEVFNALR